MTRETEPSYGELACKAWTASHEAHHPGCQIRSWDDLPAQDRADWQVAAEAVLDWIARD